SQLAPLVGPAAAVADEAAAGLVGGALDPWPARAQHVDPGAVEEDARAVRRKVEETEIRRRVAAAEPQGQAGEGRGVRAERRRRLQDDASLRIAVEAEVERVEPPGGIAGVVVEEAVD